MTTDLNRQEVERRCKVARPPQEYSQTCPLITP